MMKRNGILRFVTIWTVLGTLAVLVVLMVIWGLALRGLAPAQATPTQPTAVVNIIFAPTPTALVLITPDPTATSTIPASGSLSTPASNAQIKVGDYVQISGTGGDGLRIRSGAGTGNAPLFLGMESEVFKVIGGPQDADGITWWNLSAPYDDTRQGWAASNYLSVVAQKP
jgi:hypothetical protein